MDVGKAEERWECAEAFIWLTVMEMEEKNMDKIQMKGGGGVAVIHKQIILGSSGTREAKSGLYP